MDSHFGLNQEVTGRINNNYRKYKGVGAGRNAARIEVGGLLDAGVNVKFQMFNGNFLKYVFGGVTGAGSVGDPYAYAESDTVPSLTIEDAFDLSTDQVLRYLGSMCNKCTMVCRLNEPVDVTMEFMSQKPTKSATYQSIEVPSTNLFLFTHGTLETPQGTTITEVQEVQLVIDNKARLTGGIGSRTGVAKVSGRDYSGRFRVNINDGTSIEDAMGGAAAISTGTPAVNATLRLNFTDGARYIYVDIAAVNFDWESSKAMDKEIEETVPFVAKSGSAMEVI